MKVIRLIATLTIYVDDMFVKKLKLLIPILLLYIFSVGLSLHAQTPAPTPVIVQIQTPSKDFTDYLLALIQVLTLIALVIYVVKTWQIASANREAAAQAQRSVELSQKSIELSQAVLAEMKAARGQEIAPYVIVYIDMPYDGEYIFYFVVKNIGKTTAKDIKLKFDPPLQNGFGNKVNDFDIGIVRDGIRSLAPSQEIRTVFDVWTNYFGDVVKLLEHPLPLIYKVQVTYIGGIEEESFSTEQVIDLSIFKDVWNTDRKTEQDFIKSIEGLAKISNHIPRYLAMIANSLSNSTLLKNPESLIGTLQQSLDEKETDETTGEVIETADEQIETSLEKSEENM